MVWVIVILAGMGFYISTYFTLVAYGVVSATTRLMPSVCRLDERSCQSVLYTPYARLFGAPNFVLGLFYYALILVSAAGGWLASSPTLLIGLRGLAWATVVLGLHLTYALIERVRVHCLLCYAAHVINLALAICLTLV